MITVDEYYKMADSGLIAPDSRVELLDGEIVEMAPIGSPHAACVSWLDAALGRLLAGRAIVRVQNPIRLSRFSEPEPDLALVRPTEDFYRHAHPGPGDVFLLVEVADSTAKFDRKRKVPMYLAAGIPEVWLVDLNLKLVEVCVGNAVVTYRPGDTLSPRPFPDIAIEVSKILV